jgi:UDP-glucose 4-epimerase
MELSSKIISSYLTNNNKSILVNLGSNNGYSVKEVIDAASIYGKVNYEIVERREGDPAKLIASNSKAKDLLGWIPKYTLDDMIKTDLEFRRKINNK